MAHGHTTPSTMNHSAQCCARFTEAIASTPAGQACLGKVTENENRHLSERIQQQPEGDLASAQGEMSASNNATEAVPPTSKFLPFNLVEDMTTTQTPAAEQATGTSATNDPHGHSATVDTDF